MLLRYFFVVALAMHGLAHITGFIASWTSLPAGYPEKPWVLSSSVTLQSPIGRVFGALWLVASVTLVGAAVGLVRRSEWWPGLAMAGATLSLLVILPWWNTVPPGAKIGAAFDVLVMLALLLPLREQIMGAMR